MHSAAAFVAHNFNTGAFSSRGATQKHIVALNILANANMHYVINIIFIKITEGCILIQFL